MVLDERVRVFVRCRPYPDDGEEDRGTHETTTFLTPSELRQAERLESCVSSNGDGRIHFASDGQQKSFQFDGYLDERTSQDETYEKCARRVVDLVCQGHCGTVLAYGQTGSGKTHTMRHGIAPRAFQSIFDGNCSCSMSYVQIYCEMLTDLLSDDREARLTLRERPAYEENGGVFVEGLSRVPVASVSDALAALDAGDARRATAATPYNQASSRSHAVATIYVERKDGRRGVLTLVDLAGSEKSAMLGYQRLEECKSINVSLAALGNCVSALAQKRPHVPFRDSKLTRLLQGSLGGTAVTSLVATVSPANSGRTASETKSTLEFASRAALVRVRAQPREVGVDYQKLYEETREALDRCGEQLSAAQLASAELRRSSENLRERVAGLEIECDSRRRKLEAADRRRSELVIGKTDVDAIEALHAKWAIEAAEVDDRHDAELAVCKALAANRVAAYRSAAESATADCDGAEEELTIERTAHLDTLAALRALEERMEENEKRSAQRIAELIVENNDRSEAEAELESKLELAKTSAAESAAELERRVAALEVAERHKLQDIDANYVSRNQVIEMEQLFEQTVGLLAKRLSSLEQSRLRAIASGNARGSMSHAARDLLKDLEERTDPSQKKKITASPPKPPLPELGRRGPPNQKLRGGATSHFTGLNANSNKGRRDAPLHMGNRRQSTSGGPIFY